MLSGRFFFTSLAVLAFAVVPQAVLADEAYVEGIVGLSWNREESAAVTGIAAGYDFDLDERFFVGIEALAEKELKSRTRVAWGIGPRLGVEVIERGKAFIGMNWQSKDCGECNEAIGITTGWEQEVGERLYIKLEYKHLVIEDERDKDLAVIGLGVMF